MIFTQPLSKTRGRPCMCMRRLPVPAHHISRSSLMPAPLYLQRVFQFSPEVLALKHECMILGQWSNPVSGPTKSHASSPCTQSNLFHHGETTYRVGGMYENPTIVLQSKELSFSQLRNEIRIGGHWSVKRQIGSRDNNWHWLVRARKSANFPNCKKDQFANIYVVVKEGFRECVL